MRIVNGINLFKCTMGLPLILHICVWAVARDSVLVLFLYSQKDFTVEIKAEPSIFHLSFFDQLAATVLHIQNTQASHQKGLTLRQIGDCLETKWDYVCVRCRT